jgi:multiple sugar transport system substrate-binding protein
MPNIEISLISTAYDADMVQRVLNEFEQQFHVQTQLQQQSWGNAWSELVKVSLYNHGPDVSEIGSTWVNDLNAMNSLLPFSKQQIDDLGGEEAFLPSSWKSGVLPQTGEVLAVPWLADTRLLFYRRDLLKKANIDEASAFISPSALQETLTRLKESGVAVPLAIPTHKTRMTLQNASSWVWGAGGDFISEDNKQTLLNSPETRLGLRQYFELGSFLPDNAFELDDTQSDALYWQGKAAVTISGPWLLKDRTIQRLVVQNTGITFPPGVPFVGGSHLVMWKHSHFEAEAFQLVRFLTGLRFQTTHLHQLGLLPARAEALAAEENAIDPIYQMLNDGLRIGRSFTMTPLWGLVEDRLSSALLSVWQEISHNRNADLDRLLARALDPLTHQLDNILLNR